jgi:hypothetical protein
MNEAFKAKEGMAVMASCGTAIGRVDRLEGDMIKLQKDEVESIAKARFVPVEWVASVNAESQVVTLNRSYDDVEHEWAWKTMAS